MFPSDLLSTAMALHKSGDLIKAEEIYNQILKTQPDDLEVVHFLGIIAWQRRDFDRAMHLFEKVCSACPSNVLYHLEYAEVLQEYNMFKESLAVYQKAVSIDKENIATHSKIASLYIILNDLESAEKSLEMILQTKPDFPKAHNDLGFIYLRREEFKKAVGCFQQAIRLKNDFAEAYCYLGNAQCGMGDLSAAIASYKQAIKINPDFFEAYYNFGTCLIEANKFDQAIACFKSAILLRPNDAQTIADSGLAKFATGDIVEAEKAFRLALEQGIRPNARIFSNFLLCINYMPEYSPAQLYKEHLEFGKAFNIPGSRSGRFVHNPGTDRKLRIGYVSADFCGHAISRFMVPVLQWHAKDLVETFCYSNGARCDAVTGQFEALSDYWRDIHRASDEQAAEMIRADGIDILVDLSGHTGKNRIPMFAQKPAPIQALYLGYPNTTGLSSMDYYITDAFVDPPGQEEFFTEKLVRLGKCFCCYEPAHVAPVVNVLPAYKRGFVTFGSLHTLSRLNNEVLDLWCQVLLAIPRSRLFIARNTLVGSAVQRLAAIFEKNGVSGDRIDMRSNPPSEGYLGWFHEIDIALDTFPWSGHTTACEALWMGVPVVTLCGDRHAGRMVAGILTNAGLEDWVMHSREEYCRRAQQAAGDIENLGRLRSGLRSRMRESDLCNGKDFAIEIEKAYRSMWKNWCEKPEH